MTNKRDLAQIIVHYLSCYYKLIKLSLIKTKNHIYKSIWSRCCVCLGEFEMKEELLQMPSCKHVFHIDCIHHWLHNNTTCPLCRCSIISDIKLANHPPSPPTMAEPPLEQQQLQENTSSSDSNEMNPSQPQSVVIHVQTLP